MCFAKCHLCAGDRMFRTCDVKCSCACSHLVSPGGAAGVLSGVAVEAELAVPPLHVFDSHICCCC